MDATPRKRSKIVTLSVHCNKTQREIASLCHVSQKTVSNILRRYHESGSFSPQRQGKCGRKRKTTARADRCLLQESVKFPKKTSDQLKRDMCDRTGNISARTVRRRLLEAGRPARRPIRKQFLTAVMKKKRLQWAKEHKHWSKEDWSKVSFVVFGYTDSAISLC